jgi:hypothetical protein
MNNQYIVSSPPGSKIFTDSTTVEDQTEYLCTLFKRHNNNYSKTSGRGVDISKIPSLYKDNYRPVMAGWVSSVSEYCKFNEQVLHLTMELSDRMLSKATHQNDTAIKNNTLLCIMSSFAVAVKVLHGSDVIESLSSLSREEITPEMLTSKEREIISNLDGYLNPPTLFDYTSGFANIVICLAKEQGLDTSKEEWINLETRFVVSAREQTSQQIFLNATEMLTTAIRIVDDELFKNFGTHHQLRSSFRDLASQHFTNVYYYNPVLKSCPLPLNLLNDR